MRLLHLVSLRLLSLQAGKTAETLPGAGINNESPSANDQTLTGGVIESVLTLRAEDELRQECTGQVNTNKSNM